MAEKNWVVQRVKGGVLVPRLNQMVFPDADARELALELLEALGLSVELDEPAPKGKPTATRQ